MEKNKNSFDMFADIAKQFNFTSNKGGKTESIYRKSAFDISKSDKQNRVSLRKKIVVLAKNATTIFASKDTKKINAFCNAFDNYYKATYIINDYSLQSVCSAQFKEKDLLQKLLDNVKKNLKK